MHLETRGKGAGFCLGLEYTNTSSHSFVIIFGMAFNGDDGFALDKI